MQSTRQTSISNSAQTLAASAANDDASLFLPVPWDELMDLGFCPALQLRGFPLAKTLPQRK
jgi:hypothetical protein